MATGRVNTYATPRSRVLKSHEKAALGGGKTTFECGQTKCYPTKHLLGQFKVSLPHGQIKVRPAAVPIQRKENT